MKDVKAKAKKSIIARRRRCRASGAGLSHYIFQDKK